MQTQGLLYYEFESGCASALAQWAEVKFGADDDTVAAAGTNDPLAIGWAHFDYPTAQINRPISIALNGYAIIPVKVGTGGATRGKQAITVADGYTDAANNGGGTTSQIIKGRFMQSGVVGDLVGLLIGGNDRSVSA
jgi:hypothetical protein